MRKKTSRAIHEAITLLELYTEVGHLLAENVNEIPDGAFKDKLIEKLIFIGLSADAMTEEEK